MGCNIWYTTCTKFEHSGSASESGEKFEPISTNPYLSIINRLFNEINRLFLEFLLEIENFIENRSDISLKFFISTGYFQISTGYLITKPWFSPDIVLHSEVLSALIPMGLYPHSQKICGLTGLVPTDF
jgi:hypothetical protein